MRVMTVFLLLLPVLVTAHPIKMSLLYISYAPDNESVYIECRVFGDDLNVALEQELAKTINLESFSETDKETLNSFINKHVKVGFGNRTLDLEFYEHDYSPGSKVLTLKYKFSSLTIGAGEQVSLTNTLFFKQFPTAQSNWYELEIPRVVKTTFQCHSTNGCTKTFTAK